ncbi:MAG: 23S rRNA (adenine(2503)-C2)-methyltransferase, partial [Thermorudis peleae]|nr:23S rRNA (adenine(2503)-C2)-methyltransferase [Thermorudis peleae]
MSKIDVTQASQTMTTPTPLRTIRPRRPRQQRPTTLHDLTLAELEQRLVAQGHQPYRARQLFHW